MDTKNSKSESEYILESLEEIKKIYLSRLSLYDHFYSGDSDTYTEAFNSIVNNKYKLGDFYDLSIDERTKLSDIYSSEINTEFNRLCSFGKEIISEIRSEIDNISNIIKFEQNYMCVNDRRDYVLNKIIKDY